VNRQPPHLIVGCGYTGMALARFLVERGQTAIGTSRSELRRGEIEDAGAAFLPVDLDRDKKLPEGPFSSVTVLAPPSDDIEAVSGRIHRVVLAAGDAPVTVVVSTALFGETKGTVSERTHPAPRTDRQRRWYMQEAAALACRLAPADVAVVRVPEIYGPGRDHRAKLLTGAAKVIRPAEPTSRIHVEDLAALLARMTMPGRPPLLLACDELPVPNWRVVHEAARLLGLPEPAEMSMAEAAEGLPETGLAMTMTGRSCRSIVRPWLGVRLRYPTYREGLRACLLRS
jgi:nucleoside-diphosphate-sugar epimerase